jgi:hypothetical protein
MPNPNYMQEQQFINWGMRSTLVDWMISIHSYFRFLPETLFLATNILDRFLSIRLAHIDKLQLVGAASMFIAAKAEEMYTPGVQNFVTIADNAFTEAELLKAEQYMLKTVEWNLSYPNPINFLRRVSKADEYDVNVRTLAKFFCEIGVVEHKMMHIVPSLLAAASIWLGRLVLGSGEWVGDNVRVAFVVLILGRLQISCITQRIPKPRSYRLLTSWWLICFGQRSSTNISLRSMPRRSSAG